MSRKNNSLKNIILVLILSFFLNLLWELSHSLLYNWNASPLQNTVQFYVPKILISSLGDVMYFFIILLVVSLFKKGFYWISKPDKKSYILLIVLGIIFAFFIEVKAKMLGLWAYNQYMPLLFGIGITPLLQLAVTSFLSLYLVNNFIFKMKGGNRK